MLLENTLIQIVAEKKQQGVNKIVTLNYLKEYIQLVVLSLLYNSKNFKTLIFKGGSCLRVCYDLPRLSEDLDFDYDMVEIKKSLLPALDEYLSRTIKQTYFSQLETKIQSTIRLYLKFPLLYDLGITQKPESNKLYVKLETTDNLLPYAKFEITPVSRFGFNFVANHYDLPTLMVGKINALLYRLWYKGKNKEVDIKGRDFYDIYWFLQKRVEPNWKTLKKTTGIKSERELKLLLLERAKKNITPQKLRYDLQNFFLDRQFVTDFSKNYLEIIKKYL
ncbi:hypothetical protein A2767_07585 [Candidatus Roizmanbacteria bacterium RIFCSPHIGHO2_01_FULL_35_10]|uniref:Nucleotidyl transferase AbiEii/AbiGii toxin family protein n=1 Tax=Candidatus Roizmanbacteria bacterium RIFCSPLOWO2_01_FULL_35_13 TaxID=1802055 RepID=A0A1F7ICP1_9BACT|nr:MAG: hypothetical protein A2767_07585 [Candidatus Roizmanbacteria bacterium RIFCSPHIGHO2_01_FULL_35_10]OGK41129.1 MAG: hypothetical protein A3A74_02185 [Candidatus Roizmanbacteria bacterium RIFCSPLOWO2_01_FULL_35_13]